MVGIGRSPRFGLVACDPTSRGDPISHPGDAGRRPAGRLRPPGGGRGRGVHLGAARSAAADAPTLAIAFWRNALSLPVLALWLVARRDERAGWRARSARDRRLSRLSGVFLAAHFATWIPSLSFTTVASSVALVATQPVWAALIARQRGEHIHRQTWIGIGLALAGTLVLTGVDLSISGRALFGDVLALVGGMLAAAYVTVGG